MKNIIVNINNRTRTAKVNTKILGVVGENLQGSFIVDFKNEFISGAGFLLCVLPNGESGYVPMQRDYKKKIYTAPIKSSLLTTAGKIALQIKITESSVDDGTPIFKSNVFFMAVESAINAQTVRPEDYPDWEDVANAKLAEVDEVIERIDKRLLPNVTEAEQGKILEVNKAGEWVVSDTLRGTNAKFEEIYKLIEQKENGLPEVTKEDKGKILEVNEKGEWIISDALNEIRKKLFEVNEEVTYKAIRIISFTNDIGTVEMGTIVSIVNFSWSFNKTPASVTFAGQSMAVDSTGEIWQADVTENATWRLTATDEKGNEATEMTSITFVNGVYYGVASEPVTYDSSFVLGLQKELSDSKISYFNVNAGDKQYIYYALPVRMGTCTFKVGIFEGGFRLIDTISFTNSQGYTESYYIYRSDYDGLGVTSVQVS